ncbi:MAG TPA: Dyp-type peroxidase [Actinocatenispora sp.]
MRVPQPILGPLTRAAMFLTLTVRPGAADTVRDALSDVSGLERSVGFRSADGGLTCVVGIGSAAWEALYGTPRPADLHPFRVLTGPRHRAPATPGDILLHLRASRFDLCFELATLILDRLGSAVTVEDETHGFRYFDERDLLGFVDGTENPTGAEAQAAVLVGDEDPEFAGGSYVIVQKYLHDMAAWQALPVEEQERVIGRSKLADVEMPDDVKPADSHVALNTITDPDGTERQIVRDNMPFGSPSRGEFGTYFIGYAATPGITELMLEHMFLGNPPGTTDRILDFSTAVTGGLFFVPTRDLLDDPPEPAAAGATAAVPLADPAPVAVPVPAGDGSLRIGDLKG